MLSLDSLPDSKTKSWHHGPNGLPRAQKRSRGITGLSGSHALKNRLTGSHALKNEVVASRASHAPTRSKTTSCLLRSHKLAYTQIKIPAKAFNHAQEGRNQPTHQSTPWNKHTIRAIHLEKFAFLLQYELLHLLLP